MDAEVDIELNKMPLIGDDAPSFSADTTMGKISFPDDFKGKWVGFVFSSCRFYTGLHIRSGDLCCVGG